MKRSWSQIVEKCQRRGSKRSRICGSKRFGRPLDKFVYSKVAFAALSSGEPGLVWELGFAESNCT